MMKLRRPHIPEQRDRPDLEKARAELAADRERVKATKARTPFYKAIAEEHRRLQERNGFRELIEGIWRGDDDEGDE